MKRAFMALVGAWGLLAMLAAQAQTSPAGGMVAQAPSQAGPATSAGGASAEPNKSLVGGEKELANGNLVVATMLFTLAVHDKSLTPEQRARAYRGLGTCHAEEGNSEEAIADLNEAIRFNPRDDGAFYERANAYRVLGKQQAAINDYSQAVRLNRRNAQAFYHRGIAYGALGNLDRAIADYDAALAVDPKISSAYFDRGIAHLAKVDYDKAVSDFDAVVRLTPDRAQAWYNRANAYLYKKDFTHAAADYTQTLRLKPADSWALHNRGVCYLMMRDYEKARSDFQQFLQTNPTRDAHLSLADVNYLMGQFPQSVAEFNAARAAPADETLSVTQSDTSVLVPSEQYTMIWEFLAHRRVGQDGSKPLRDAAVHLKDAPWPAPIIAYLLGNASADDLVRQAKASDPQGHQSTLCEAHTYVAETAAIKGDSETATKLYRLASQECPPDFDEARLVAAGLKRLNAPAPAVPSAAGRSLHGVAAPANAGDTASASP